MGRVADRKSRSHCKRIHAVGHASHCQAQRLFIQYHASIAIVVMPSRNHLNRNAWKRLGNSSALHHCRIKANQHNANGAAMAFDHRIGRQGGRDRYQRNIFGLQALGKFGNRLGDSAADSYS